MFIPQNIFKNIFRKKFSLFLFFVAIIFLIASGNNCLASIGPLASGYAYGENVGWINFNPAGSAVYVGDSGLTGYAYGENVGWISLNCLNDNSCLTNNWGVANDGKGNLSGYAYGENVGWINFNPTSGNNDYGVKIDTSGNLSGSAYGENVGWISFSGNGFGVTTDWRAKVLINGVCGSANGNNFSITPVNNLCLAGSATSVSGSGPWTWTCAGINGGNSSSVCSASVLFRGGGGYFLYPNQAILVYINEELKIIILFIAKNPFASQASTQTSITINNQSNTIAIFQNILKALQSLLVIVSPKQ